MKHRSAKQYIDGVRVAGMKRLKLLNTPHKTVGAGLVPARFIAAYRQGQSGPNYSHAVI